MVHRTAKARIARPGRARACPLLAGIVLAGLALLVALPRAQAAEAAAFDLAGPQLTVTVTRGAATLPIDQVPNLREGDRVALRAVLPKDQNTHYLMVLAFLRGATNPPPKEWFFPCETWRGECAKKGLSVMVPAGAQQVLVLLAPSTSGDLRTLVGAVSGRPGSFVRASQALNQAALDRSRLDTYLAAVTHIDRTDRPRLKDATPLLARSLGLKVDEHCLDRSPELQAPCLSQGQDTLVLNDGHSKSLVDTLTSGPSADLAMVAANTQALRSSAFGPYISSLLDIGRVVTKFTTAQFQYLPALAMPQGDAVRLLLNAPPSFHEPYSVLVATLPAVASPQWPPLRAVDASAHYCARRPDLLLPVDGAPLAYSTRYFHDLVLSVKVEGGSLESPLQPDVERGGYRLDTTQFGSAPTGDTLEASMLGRWGFEQYTGPTFQLDFRPGNWQLLDPQDDSLVVGRDDIVTLKGASASCLTGVSARDATGVSLPVAWKVLEDDIVEATVSLQTAMPGPVSLQVAQLGATQPASVALRAWPDLVRIDSIAASAADGRAVIKGNRLDKVSGLRIEHTDFAVHQLVQVHGSDELTLVAGEPPESLAPRSKARVTLNEGRTMQATFTPAAAAPRPQLVSKSAAHIRHGKGYTLELAGNDDVAPDEALSFSVRIPAGSFPSDAVVEIATSDHRFHGQLLPAKGLTLAGPQVAIARFTPATLLGPLAAGLLQYRVSTGGLPSDWQDLAWVARLPEATSLDCNGSGTEPCSLKGRNLFLLEQLRVGEGEAARLCVPEGYTDEVLRFPRPASGELGFTLRDHPGANMVVRVPAPREVATPAVAAPSLAAMPAQAPAPAPVNPAAPGAAAADAATVVPPVAAPTAVPAPSVANQATSGTAPASTATTTTPQVAPGASR
jgi:hypothetical protein